MALLNHDRAVSRRRATNAVRGVAAALPAVVLAAALAVGSPTASAQSDGTALTPPQPNRDPSPPRFSTTATLLLLSAGLVGAALLPSKRGHQD